MTFWLVHDHLALLIAVNLVWAAAAGIPGSIAAAALLLEPPAWFAAFVFAGLAFGAGHAVCTASIAHVAKQCIECRDSSWHDLAAGVRMYALRAIGLGCLLYLVMVCLGISIWFYPARLGEAYPALAYALAALAFWALVFVQLCGPYVFPALVQKRKGPLATLKLSAAIVLARPVFSVLLALQAAGIFVLGIAMPPAMIFLCGSVAAVMASAAYELLARDIARGQGRDIPPDEDDDYLNRGLRDFLFPWKS